MTESIIRARACVFHAYGTLFDFASRAAALQQTFSETRQLLSLLSGAISNCNTRGCAGMQGRHTDFWQVTERRT